MQHYSVTGMSCAACSARVEKAVQNVSGVASVSVSLLTNSMVVEGNAKKEDIINAVVSAGYGASVRGGQKDRENSVSDIEDALKDTETPKLRRRFILSLIFLLPLMYVSMGHMMWDFPLPERFAENYIAIGIYQLSLTAIIMIINQKFFVSGFTGLVHRAPNMDTLVALGATASFCYSLYALFAMTDASVYGSRDDMMKYMHEFYFESAATILTLITLGKTLEAYSKGKTTDAIKGLMKLAPKTATIIKDGVECEVLVEELGIGDIFAVKPGESIPVDGVVTEGSSAVDESALTGESIPVDKEIGSEVSAATINQSGYIRCEATRVGEDTFLSQVIRMVSDAAATKAPIAKIADKVSGVFVPVVIGISVITLVSWLLAGKAVGFALSMGISVLVISCPCALGLATPVAIMVGNGVGAKNGTLFKTAASLEATGKINVIALDKTGTITKGKPQVTDVIAADGIDEKYFVKNAYAIEKLSEHPLSHAIIEYAGEQKEELNVTDFKAVAGNGLSALVDGKKVCGGNASYIGTFLKLDKKMLSKADGLAEKGKTPLYFAKEEKDGFKLLGIIAVADVIREDSIEAVSQLKNMGIHVVMLTGDNEKTARAIGDEVGVDEVVAGVLPSGKEDVIKRLKGTNNLVAMVGDGINDAPALTRADIGIAIGAGTDVAIDAADVVLMKSSVLDVASAVRLSRGVIRNIHQNLFWAFFYNVIGIPLAAGVWYPLFAIKLNPMFGAAAMGLSSFFVVTNALRLNFLKVKDKTKDKKLKEKYQYVIDMPDVKEKGDSIDKYDDEGGKNHMTKTVVIEGMMCAHCEARVKKLLLGFDEVDDAVVSHEKGTAELTLNAEIDEAKLKQAIEDEDYKFIEIK